MSSTDAIDGWARVTKMLDEVFPNWNDDKGQDRASNAVRAIRFLGLSKNLGDELVAYSKELMLSGDMDPFSMGGFINSHRTLRGEYRKTIEERNAEMEIVRARTIELARAEVTDGEYISIKKLVGMTLGELADFINQHHQP